MLKQSAKLVEVANLFLAEWRYLEREGVKKAQADG
jgi:hypothetical protein